ncbi:uncharacterized protein LACBIDRAFT_296878 [Laccaria bicolor S238N-H82]|uniref:Predicted protein n=1 Tax=Laccaria bicolor (strain S238N-H82 / ATCC MYA-4686) TaxID=486041 RepID=B0D9H0_LACBS|nr:uncharacterized protein LACBIDRAFT_296878 [Laccaria bicolor S238N-H82]EDR08579.1 predicted protein [Laccaria bicolor S238N-H82]|eukprot:XP_001880804.1 predicted protein [Laccaria bicolor S238N-H82]
MASTFTISAFDHPIKSVTVFKSSKAEVVRSFDISLKKGRNNVEIRGLSSFIDTHSVRVSGLGSAARLLDVACTIATSKSASYLPDSSTEVIRKLRVRKNTLERERTLRNNESQLLLAYAGTLGGEHVNPQQMTAFLEGFMQQGKKIIEEASLSEQIIELERLIEAENEKSTSKRGTTDGKVNIVLGADEDFNAEIKLTYIVSNATWEPTYELHATTENGKPSNSVALHYRARVTQSTGEDWNNTLLTLSTVTGTTTKAIPKLRALKLHPSKATPAFNNVFQRPSAFNNHSNVTSGLFGAGNNVGPSVPGLSFSASNVPPGEKASGFQSQQAAFGSSGGFGSFANQSQQRSAFGFPQFGQQIPQPQIQQFQQQQQAQSSLFGQSHSTPGTSFGAAPSQQQPQPSLFGQPHQPQHSLFGQSHSTPGTSFGAAPSPQVLPIDPTLLAQYQAELASAEGHPLPDEDDFENVASPNTTGVEPTTVVAETPIAISYSVQGESTIPSDDVVHQVVIAVLPFEATISYISVPRIEPRVYLQCQVKNSSEYRLLAGPVTVILDDSYVSRTSIEDINTGDNFDCTLGDDASTKVTYSCTSRTAKESGGAFSETTNTTTYTTKISLHNKHAFVIDDLIVKDVIPTCDQDKRTKVILRKPAALAEAKDRQIVDLKTDGLRVGWEKVAEGGKGGEKEGKFEWRWKVGSGAKVTLDAEWEVQGPGDSPTRVFYS